MRRSIRDALRRAELSELLATNAATAEALWRGERPPRPEERTLLEQARWCMAIVAHAARAPSQRA